MSDEIIKEGYTRVTDILYPLTGLSTIPKHVLLLAAERGERVHRAIEGYYEGICFPEDPDIKGYLQSFTKWWDQFIDRYDYVAPFNQEERLYCDDLKVTGKYDLILGIGNNERILVDFKTSLKYSPTWELQGSAYMHMANEAGYNVTKCLFVKLDRAGEAAIFYEIKYDFETFKDCVKIYQRFFSKIPKDVSYLLET